MPEHPAQGRGLVLGKFMPPHRGHQHLIDFARFYAGTVTVVVGTLPTEPIPGRLRYLWMREAFPDLQVLHLDEDLPQEPAGPDDDRFWAVWRTALLTLCPNPDFVFASEAYGTRLARALGATYVPVNPARDLVPISATAIRADPMAHWDRILPQAHPYFLKRVAIVGPESAGKTRLTGRLSAHYRTVHMAEYAREFLAAHGDSCDDTAQIEAIARGQAAGEDAMARQARRLLFTDTDTLTTVLWSEYFFGRCPGWIVDLVDRRPHDLYLIADVAPFVPDPQRLHPQADTRARFRDRLMAELQARGRRWVLLSGDWDQRFAKACRAVDRLLADPAPPIRRP